MAAVATIIVVMFGLGLLTMMATPAFVICLLGTVWSLAENHQEAFMPFVLGMIVFGVLSCFNRPVYW
jgi:hypothetical protein